jgi:ATP-dependent helicase HrpA
VLREQVAASSPALERTGLTSWQVGDVPREIERRKGRLAVAGFPALVDETTSVALRVLDEPGEATLAHRRGVRRLVLLSVPSPGKGAVSGLPTTARLALGWNPHGSAAALMADALACATDSLMAEHGPVPRTEAAYDAMRAAVVPRLTERLAGVLVLTAELLAAAHDLRTRAEALTGAAVAGVADDLATQLDELVFPDFLTITGWARLPDVRRYLAAMGRRLDALPERPARDRVLMADVQALETDVDAWRSALPPARRATAEAQDVWWQVQELRVSLFANGIRTAGPVSEKRIRNAMARVTRG